MTWDGAGTHNRVHNFSADASAGIQAQAARFDAEFDDISTALENCQTLTGETTPTANSPMGGFKHTGVAAATSTDNYLRADQSSNQVGIYVRDKNTGVSGTITASAAVFPTAFTDGQRVTVKVSASGSISATRTIKINGLSANIVDNDGSAVPASKMLKDGIFDLIYDSSANAFRSITSNNEAKSGKFTVAWNGFAASASSSCEYHKEGNHVILSFQNTFAVVSNASAFDTTSSVIPAVIRPASSRTCVARVTNNGTEDWGMLTIGSDGSFTFNSDAANSQFEASGTKGTRNGQMFPYFIEDA